MKINRFIKRHSLVLALLVILFFSALIPRVYGFGTVPASLNWDEMAVGVNGYLIGQEGRDEWGNFFPITFQSFGDDKNPVHVYITALFIKVFGLSDFSVRFPVLVLGTLNVILLFFVAYQLFKSYFISFISAFSLAVSPHNLIFSHFNHELNFTIFFFLLSLILFYIGKKGHKWLLFLSFVFFSIDLVSYNSPKIVVPVFLVGLCALYFKEIFHKDLRKYTFAGIALFLCVLGLVFFHPHLSGVNRAKQTTYSDYDVKQSEYFKQTNNLLLTRFLITKDQYLSHFSYMYLFVAGDENVRHSTRMYGIFYQLESILIVYGFFLLLYLRKKETIILVLLILLAPLPSALFKDAPHSARAMFMTGSMHMLVGLGAFLILRLLYSFRERVHFLHIPKKVLSLVVALPIILYLGFQVKGFLDYYVTIYPNKYAVDWQYGLKEAVLFIKSRPKAERVYVTDVRSQPYIFFRFYEPISNEEFRKRLVLDESKWKLSNTVEMYDNYVFGRWDVVHSMPTSNMIYVITASEYHGLLHRNDFEVLKIIKYPDGGEAFYIVEGHQ